MLVIAFLVFALIIFFASGRDPKSLREVARLLPHWWREGFIPRRDGAARRRR